MSKAFLQAASLAIALAFVASADITYNVSRTVGSATVTGFIETDGTTAGPLTGANFVDWSLLMVSGSASYHLTGPASGNSAGLFLTGTGVTATAQNLFFNFGGSPSQFLFQTSYGSGFNYYCDSAGVSACFNGESIVPEYVASPSAQFALPAGNVVIGSSGSAAPEPGYLLILPAMLGVVLTARKGLARLKSVS